MRAHISLVIFASMLLILSAVAFHFLHTQTFSKVNANSGSDASFRELQLYRYGDNGELFEKVSADYAEVFFAAKRIIFHHIALRSYKTQELFSADKAELDFSNMRSRMIMNGHVRLLMDGISDKYF